MAQRFAISLALARGPDALVLDEPTVGLDAAAAERILILVSDLVLNGSMAAIIVTHDLLAARVADERLVVERHGHSVVLAAGGLEAPRD
jgi:energy-coupling factor transporter ATP-binding protein EcfA2